jgi:anthranilate phosphoribosyltransferase
MASNRAFKVDTPEQSRDMLLAVLNGAEGPAADIVCLNAGAALYAAGVAESIADGLARAREALSSGAAKQRLDQLVTFTHAQAPAL